MIGIFNRYNRSAYKKTAPSVCSARDVFEVFDPHMMRLFECAEAACNSTPEAAPQALRDLMVEVRHVRWAWEFCSAYDRLSWEEKNSFRPELDRWLASGTDNQR